MAKIKLSKDQIVWISKFVLEMDRLTQERLRANTIQGKKAA